jgi:hypothetical protein
MVVAASAPCLTAAQVLVRDIHPASMQMGTLAQGSVILHQGEIRTRQDRVRQARERPAGLPVFANNLSLSGENGRIPLRLRDVPAAPQPSAAQKKLAPGAESVLTGFVRGDLQTSGGSSGTALSTTDLTVGSDYRASDRLLFGAAAGGLRTTQATGSIVSAYLTMQPVGRLFLDLSLSLGAHHNRSGAHPVPNGDGDFGAAGAAGASGTFGSAGIPGTAGTAGISRAFSLSLNHPGQVGQWSWSPYSRYDRITTDVASRGSAPSAPGITYGMSALSVGSTAATTWTTRFGRLQPTLLVELQHEIATVAGVGTTSAHTQGTVGLAMTAAVSRELSAFAESRYETDLVATLDRQMMLGVRLRF